MAERPTAAEAWGALRAAEGELAGASLAFSAALAADPFFPEALANAGLAALRAGDRPRAERLLARLDALATGRSAPEARALARGGA